MNVCTICQADGVIMVGTRWYCLDHLEDAFLILADFLATVRHWDRDETREQLQQWLGQ